MSSCRSDAISVKLGQIYIFFYPSLPFLNAKYRAACSFEQETYFAQLLVFNRFVFDEIICLFKLVLSVF